jgi:pimeloyl-ACP methyl ester carboxylesterase
LISQIEDNYCEVEGIKIRYWQKGNRSKNLVLIHGFGGSIEAWYNNINFLAHNYTVYALELPGHGKSDKPQITYSLNIFADFVDKTIKKLNINKFNIAGLSFGGAIVLKYVLKYSEKTDKIILISSAGLSPKMGFLFSLTNMVPFRGIIGIVPKSIFSFYARKTVYDSKCIPQEIIDFYYSLIKTKEFRYVLKSVQKENFSFWGHCSNHLIEISKELQKINNKTLIVWGKNDTIIPVRNAYIGKKLLKNSGIVIYEDCRHNPQFEKAQEFNNDVLKFLEE